MAALPEPISGRIDNHLLVVLNAAWQDLAECTSDIAQASSVIEEAPTKSAPTSAIREWYEETTRLLLKDPVEHFLRVQPIRQALEAMRDCDHQISPALARSRWRLDARFQRLLTLTALDLCEPWRIWHGGDHTAEWDAWEQRREKHSQEALAVLDHYSQWTQKGAGILGRIRPASGDDMSDAWWHQHSALITTIEEEVALRDLTLLWFDAAHEFAESVLREREDLRSHTASVLQQLQEARTNGITCQICALLPAEERLRVWALPVEAEAHRRLPQHVEILVAGHKPRLRSVAIHTSFMKAFDKYARAPMRAIIEQAYRHNADRLREVDMAMEMIAYWTEESSDRTNEASEALAEARHNAVANLTKQLQAPSNQDELDVQIADAFWTWHTKGFLAFEAGQYGWMALLRHPRGRALPGIAIAEGQRKAHVALQRVGGWTSARVDRAMESVGGRVPSQPTLPAVVRRTTLRDTLALPATKVDIPAVYRLLFRLAPVEDLRFLVGRERELAGLKQALEDWKAGKFAACLIIGGRGSGKTSLLNCAMQQVFAGQECLRTRFHDRILSQEKLDAFLRDLLHVRGDADLDSALRAERRIVILEEGERVYLRRVGGFAAADYLTLMVQRTASTTLWIVVMNNRSFRVLDSATGCGRIFSHRINAMNVSRTDLENAILERHRLSGLRLDFAPPPAGDPRVNRLKQWIGLEDSGQKLFFDSLFQQSEGVFRSAFQLWLSSIESVQGETLKIRQPLDPAFARFRRELAQEDQFTLLVIQEHGSLTDEELAQVLCESPEQSSGRMARLSALGLIQPDPDHAGLRVNPEAQRFVNDVLRRTNLT